MKLQSKSSLCSNNVLACNTRQREIAQLMLNPMDIESQRKIEELIQQKNIEENFMQAFAFSIESDLMSYEP